MKYVKITKNDVANGPGVRAVLWVSGCTHHCLGCHNQNTWDPDIGEDFTEKVKEELFLALSPAYVSGITFSGGDPLHKNNIKDILSLIEEIKEKMPEKTIWLYTGYIWEDIKEKQDDADMKIRKKIIENIDILIDGPFILKQKNIMLPWCGSSNQRVIDIKESIKEGEIVLYSL